MKVWLEIGRLSQGRVSTTSSASHFLPFGSWPGMVGQMTHTPIVTILPTQMEVTTQFHHGWWRKLGFGQWKPTKESGHAVEIMSGHGLWPRRLFMRLVLSNVTATFWKAPPRHYKKLNPQDFLCNSNSSCYFSMKIFLIFSAHALVYSICSLYINEESWCKERRKQPLSRLLCMFTLA